jgi:hypothetical protein
LLLIRAQSAVLNWTQEAALAGDDYKNPEVVCEYKELAMGEYIGTWGEDVAEKETQNGDELSI